MKKKNAKSRFLHLAHRAHTGKKLHRRHTSYPALAALLLMSGVLLAAASLPVGALDVTVTGQYTGGAVPAVPAVILSPADGQQFTTSNVPVSGTCEAGYFVRLYRNDVFSGATICTAGSTFALATDLFAGQNDLQARTYNAASIEGPRSDTVHVYYDPPPPSTPGEQPSLQPEPGQTPFYLSTDYFFKAAASGQPVTWQFEVFGGTSPFTVYVDWGDGYSDVVPGSTRNINLRHEYESPRERREYFTVKVRVEDTAGRQANLQLIAIMNDPDALGGALATAGGAPPASQASPGIMTFAWWAYAVVVLMGICFWLGERRGESVTAAWYRRRAS